MIKLEICYHEARLCGRPDKVLNAEVPCGLVD